MGGAAGAGAQPSGGQAGAGQAGEGQPGGGQAGGGPAGGGQAGGGQPGGGSAGQAGAGGGSAEIPPTEAVALLSYLQAGSYLGFAGESKVHSSTGPHGSGVRTYVNQALRASLMANAGEHPVGAAAVKELYDGGGALSGWAVEVKTQATSEGGDGWYWYEILSTQGEPLIGASGPNFCSNCHASGSDYVLVPFPLQ